MNFRRSTRWTHDGWALQLRTASVPMNWTLCTTRAEARALRDSSEWLREMRPDVVAVRLRLEAVNK